VDEGHGLCEADANILSEPKAAEPKASEPKSAGPMHGGEDIDRTTSSAQAIPARSHHSLITRLQRELLLE